MAHLVYSFDALDPYDSVGTKRKIIGLEQAQVDAMLHSHDAVRLKRLELAKEVCESPLVVFEDWKRPDNEDGLCYCGRPSRDFQGPSIQRPPPPGMVFCVFVKPSGKITAWRWEPCDKFEIDFPEDWKNRFGRILWPPAQPS